MHGLHGSAGGFPYGLSFAGDLIGFTTGLLVAILLLALTARAMKLPGTPVANLIFAACALLWSLGGLTHVALRASGMASDARLVMAAQSLQFTGVAGFPFPVLATWRRFAVAGWQRSAVRVLFVASGSAMLVILALQWQAALAGSDRSFLNSMMHATVGTGLLTLVAGAAVSLRPGSTPRAVLVPSLAIVITVTCASLAMLMARHVSLPFDHAWVFLMAARHCVMVVVLCAFFLFVRFRYRDVFIRYGTRVLLAGLWAALIAACAQSEFLLHLARSTPAPQSVHVFAVLLVANALLLSFTFMDERLSTFVGRLLFRPPDYRERARQLAERLRIMETEAEIAAAVEETARETLAVDAARIVPFDGVTWAAGVKEGEVVEIPPETPGLTGVELLVPISTAGRVTAVLMITPGASRPSLVTAEVNFLRTIATQCGHRLDALRLEREAAERRSREARLLQQVTEAELRALRAQINPHFLFNSLNTIADLIVRDPACAETMTVRLADVFRHVLAHSSRSLATVHDEIEFLRTYLYIEEVRFRDRLQVEFDIADDVAAEQIPSLVLQPLVENALKHGLAPKPGRVRLRIAAHRDNGHLRLTVEDDGVGPGSNGSKGHGLANVAERLRTLYQERASVSLEPREGGGSRATILIPQ